MKIDYEYLKGLLEAFENGSGPFATIKELKINLASPALANIDNFIFHMNIFIDLKFIEILSRKVGTVWNDQDIVRLTAAGYNFSSLLKDAFIWEMLKKFKHLSINMIEEAAKILLKNKNHINIESLKPSSSESNLSE